MQMLLDQTSMHDTHPDEFARAKPFPSHQFSDFLSKEGFAALHREFPETEKFERHRGLQRVHDQRIHDRLYLAYEHSIYRGKHPSDEGVIRNPELSATWRQFIEELSGSTYLDFVCALFGVEDVLVRYAWHIGGNGSEVSPHVDAFEKLGTHIFYFNVREDWDEAWGGDTLLLGDKQVDRQNPEFGDFLDVQSVSCLGNRSLLFQNGKSAWHGVRQLACPSGAQRRLFNVIFENPGGSKPRRGWAPLEFLTKSMGIVGK